MNALPLNFLQLEQWQTLKVNGSPVTLSWTRLHRQDPFVCMVVILVNCFWFADRRFALHKPVVTDITVPSRC